MIAQTVVKLTLGDYQTHKAYFEMPDITSVRGIDISDSNEIRTGSF